MSSNDPWAESETRSQPPGTPALPGGTVYLLHFSQPYKPAKHYTGWASDLKTRLAEHEQGQGARLLQVMKAAGISWTLVRTWPGDRKRERELKNMGGASRRCPQCGINPQADHKRHGQAQPVKAQDPWAGSEKASAAEQGNGGGQPMTVSQAPSQHPADKDLAQHAGRPPEYVVETWVSKQLRDRIQRTGPSLAEVLQTPDRQTRAPLADREAEP